jgi:NitT/TauT family transport system ATP-binding protein
MTPLLDARDLSFGYPRQAQVISNLSFDTGSARAPALIGRSGAGKTTLLSLIAGHLTPNTGTLLVDGEAVKGPSASRTLVFQAHNLFPWLTARENVAFGPRCNGQSKADACKVAGDILTRFGLSNFADAFPHELSGGMRQRTAIARALAVNPACLIIDEPFSSLDIETKYLIIDDIKAHALAHGTRLIMASHNPNDIEALCDCAISIRADGRIDFFDRVQDAVTFMNERGAPNVKRHS